MRALFLCSTQLQVVNYLLILDSIIDEVDEVVFIFFKKSRPGLLDVVPGLERISSKVKVFILDVPSISFKLKALNKDFRASLGDVFLFKFHLLRRYIRNKYYKNLVSDAFSDFVKQETTDVLYIANLTQFSCWLADSVLRKNGQLIYVEEGVGSYLSSTYKKEFLKKITEIKIFDKNLFSVALPKRIRISEMNSRAFMVERVSNWLKEVFPRPRAVNTPNSSGDLPVWMGQNLGKVGSLEGESYRKVFNLFKEKYKDIGFVYRPHPAESSDLILDGLHKNYILDRGSRIPFEVELLLGYRSFPKEIHTVASTGAIYIHILFGKKSSSVKSFIYNKVYENVLKSSGSSKESKKLKEIDNFILTMSSKYPDKILIQE